MIINERAVLKTSICTLLWLPGCFMKLLLLLSFFIDVHKGVTHPMAQREPYTVVR